MIGQDPFISFPSAMDPRFRVDLIAATPNPQQCVYAGMHQDSVSYTHLTLPTNREV